MFLSFIVFSVLVFFKSNVFFTITVIVFFYWFIENSFILYSGIRKFELCSENSVVSSNIF